MSNHIISVTIIKNNDQDITQTNQQLAKNQIEPVINKHRDMYLASHNIVSDIKEHDGYYYFTIEASGSGTLYDFYKEYEAVRTAVIQSIANTSSDVYHIGFDEELGLIQQSENPNTPHQIVFFEDVSYLMDASQSEKIIRDTLDVDDNKISCVLTPSNGYQYFIIGPLTTDEVTRIKASLDKNKEDEIIEHINIISL